MNMRASLLANVCFGVCLLSTAASTQAAVFSVQSCRDDRGAPTPASDASGGWVSEGVGPSRDASNTCSSTDPRLVASIGGASPIDVGSAVGWRFDPPRGTFVAGFRVVYSGYARPYDGRNQGVVEVSDTDAGQVASHQGVGSISERIAAADGRHAQALRVVAQCDGPAGNPPCPAGVSHANVALKRSLLTLVDESPPTSEPPSGSAVDATTWQGPQTLAVSAADVGSGLYRWSIDVDGSEVKSGPVDGSERWCVDASAGARLFSVPRPCPTAKDLVLPIDADALPPGTHDVTVRISDAAGNAHTVFTARRSIVPSARTIGPGTDISVRGGTNGVNASDGAILTARWTRTRRPSLSIRYGSRPVIRGRLTTAAKVGIGAARLELLARPVGRVGAPIDKGGARTRPDGRFTLVLPRNLSSRDIALSYRARVNDTVPSAWASLKLRVRAAVRLSATPRRVGQGRETKLRGRLVAGPVPAGGKVLELQARDPGGRWLTFRTVRTTNRGAFSARYRFRRPGPATYEMRVRSRASSDYPYATGASRIVRVRVR